MEPLGGNRGHQDSAPYPSGPSKPSTFKSLGHVGIIGALTPSVMILLFVTQETADLFFLDYLVSVRYRYNAKNLVFHGKSCTVPYVVVEKKNVLSFFLFFT
jgi:hypothetical protein